MCVDAMSVFATILPLTNVAVAIAIYHSALFMMLVIEKIALMDFSLIITAFINQYSSTVFLISTYLLFSHVVEVRYILVHLSHLSIIEIALELGTVPHEDWELASELLKQIGLIST